MTTAEQAAHRKAQQSHDGDSPVGPPDAGKRRRVNGLLVLVLACLVGVGVLAYKSLQAATAWGQREGHSLAVISQLDEFMSSLKDAETGQRGYIITGLPEYLEPYNASVGVFAARLESLRLLTAGDARQQQRIVTLTQLLGQRMAIFQETIAVRQTQGLLAASQAVTALAGKTTMDQLRVLVGETKAEEAENLKSYATQSAADIRRTLQAMLLGGTLGALALLLLFVCLRRELAGRQHAEKELRHSAWQYHLLFDSIDEAFCIVELIFDDGKAPVDYRFLEVNRAFEKQTGMSDAKGKRMLELVPDMEAQWFEIYGKVALTGEPHRFVSEAKGLAGRWFDAYAFRLGNPESGRVAVLFRDISERVKNEEAMRQSEARFRALFDWGPIAIFSSDAAGRLQECNRAALELWGAEPEDGKGDKSFFQAPQQDHLPDETRAPTLQSRTAEVLKGNIPAIYDEAFVIERPTAPSMTVIAHVVPLLGKAGDITGAITCCYDVTERARLQHETAEQAQALVELHQRKDEFLAMLSHELRNPLAALANALLLLRLPADADPLQQQSRGIMERQLKHLKHLVDDLLEVSRITTGNVRLRLEPVSLNSIVEGAVEAANPLIAEQRHELSVSLPQAPVFVHADAARLEQVLVNLLTNAAKYTPNGGHIWLSVETEPAASGGQAAEPLVAIRVRDNGLGMAPALLPRIFDLFTQADHSLDRSQGGLGIGLSLVKQLVELHGGTVTVSSTLGQGSEFVVRLPAMPTVLAPATPAQDGNTRPAPKVPQRILVVDDNVDAAQSLAMLLEMTGHDTRLAYDGPAAVQAAIDYHPDVVLLDIGLPGLDGYKVAQRIRQQAELKNVVLVALTGYGQDSDRQLSQDAGFDHHLVKPADYNDIEKILRSVS
ncbi:MULTISPECIES: CHASE3 domain-containing protein [unclassified Polaromonas]|uniref:CHASE3 domain-containing protein n=1 Tax=unclassified Polaromonas TaxID=2638319 RepID=UPI0018C96B84|nr:MULTISPECIES: CHASE3 domain-containing protein [unclassified Polaromonas]MBG6071470.1 PAS domain S-box-containing protein [Polaromonas sp. CG_9.7]MBG6113471.1 PAS domain S-box-containing protein [Polaromonas sp. CG_9.2]MDH6183072.1 PAS domain S-box-containing protein [Polaromonas sp. CG_23.6]